MGSSEERLVAREGSGDTERKITIGPSDDEYLVSEFDARRSVGNLHFAASNQHDEREHLVAVGFLNRLTGDVAVIGQLEFSALDKATSERIDAERTLRPVLSIEVVRVPDVHSGDPDECFHIKWRTDLLFRGLSVLVVPLADVTDSLSSKPLSCQR